MSKNNAETKILDKVAESDSQARPDNNKARIASGNEGYSATEEPEIKIVYAIFDSGMCPKIRAEWPAMKMVEHYPNVKVRFKTHLQPADIQWCDIVVLERIGPTHENAINYAKQIGKVSVFESDDLDWRLPHHNPLWKLYQWQDYPKLIKRWMGMCDYITTTTPILAREMAKVTGNGKKNIKVFPNRIDLKAKQWNFPKKLKKDKNEIVIGFAGGSTHLEDLRLLSGVMQAICQEFSNVKFMICGYDTRGAMNKLYRDEKGEKKVEKINMEDLSEEELKKVNVWEHLVDLFRSLGDKLIVKNSLPIDEYPVFFTEMDIGVAPLIDSDFNNSKSPLKLVEMGSYSIPVVASNVGPFRLVINHGENGFLADNKRHRKGFLRYIRQLVEKPDLREKFGRNLRKSIERDYDLNTHVDEYYNWYKQISGKVIKEV